MNISCLRYSYFRHLESCCYRSVRICRSTIVCNHRHVRVCGRSTPDLAARCRGTRCGITGSTCRFANYGALWCRGFVWGDGARDQCRGKFWTPLDAHSRRTGRALGTAVCRISHTDSSDSVHLVIGLIVLREARCLATPYRAPFSVVRIAFRLRSGPHKV